MYKESEILKEASGLNGIFYSDDKYGIYSIPNYSHNPCFAILIGDDKISRISLLEPKYIECEYENYRLTKEEIDDLMVILNSTNKIPFLDKYYQVWKILLQEQNIELEYEKDDQGNPFHIDENLPIPDYYQLLNS